MVNRLFKYNVAFKKYLIDALRIYLIKNLKTFFLTKAAVRYKTDGF